MKASELIKQLEEIVKEGDVDVYAENPHGRVVFIVTGAESASDDVTDDEFVLITTETQPKGGRR